jgi:hypothetical protein
MLNRLPQALEFCDAATFKSPMKEPMDISPIPIEKKPAFKTSLLNNDNLKSNHISQMNQTNQVNQINRSSNVNHIPATPAFRSPNLQSATPQSTIKTQSATVLTPADGALLSSKSQSKLSTVVSKTFDYLFGW